jgi:hypothetical protein
MSVVWTADPLLLVYLEKQTFAVSGGIPRMGHIAIPALCRLFGWTGRLVKFIGEDWPIPHPNNLKWRAVCLFYAVQVQWGPL